MQPVFYPISARTEVRPLFFSAYYIAALALGIGGFLASVYLSVSHYRGYTDINYRSFCAISNAFNCDTVSQSPFSVVLGLPIAVWGVIGYAGLTMVSACAGLKAAGHQRIWTLVFSLAFMFSLVSLLLAGISTYKIGSYCIVCISTYAVNLMLLFLTWIVRRRYECGPLLLALREDIVFLWRRVPVSLGILLSLAASVFGAYRLIPGYWEFKPPPAVTTMNQGQNDDGTPWIGAANPLVTITEFADYQCFQCRKMHFYLRALISKYPEAIRLVHRHYPMDSEVNFIVHEPFHVGSGRMALLAIHAETKGKFWQMNDVLYDLGRRGKDIDLREIAARTHIDVRELEAALQHPYYRDRLMIDIRTGMKLRILGTPSFVIDGKVYQGNIPADVLADILRRLETN
jgi:uncharacterized membrane protein/protein-disulfide isomerase